jgi:hypothetical protein
MLAWLSPTDPNALDLNAVSICLVTELLFNGLPGKGMFDNTGIVYPGYCVFIKFKIWVFNVFVLKRLT